MDLVEMTIPVGSTPESVLQRQDLTEYKREAKFRRLTLNFFDYWYPVVVRRAKGKKVLVHSMESFGGETIDKFEELDIPTQESVITSKNPFKMLLELTNLQIPRLFLQVQDVKDFKEVFVTHEF